jgi:predicted dehydrogenase
LSSAIGIGVIGAGILGKRHVRVFSELTGSRVEAVADTAFERAEKAAGAVGGRAYPDYTSLLADSAVDAVVVATPDHLHYEPVMAALQAGKHVFVEKPLATDLREARAMVEQAQRAGLTLQVNFSQRFVPEHAWAKRQIEEGAIGDVLVYRSVANDTISVPTEMIPWSTHSSPVLFMSSHHLDLICWYAAAAPEEASAYEVSRALQARGFGTPDAIEAVVRFSNGSLANVHSAWVYPNTYPTVADSSLEIIGTEGVIQLDLGGSGYLYTSGSAQKVKLATAYEVGEHLYGAFRHSLELFLDSVATGSEPMTSAAKTLPVAVVQAAIAESLGTGAPAKVAWPEDGPRGRKGTAPLAATTRAER